MNKYIIKTPNTLRIYKTPKKFTVNFASSFISDVNEIFELKDRLVSNVMFDVSKTAEIDILGTLLTYKFIDFTYHNKCFNQPMSNLKAPKNIFGITLPGPKDKTVVYKSLIDIGLKEYVDDCFDKKSNIEFEIKNELNTIDNFHIWPIITSKKNTRDVKEKNQKLIKDYYDYDETIASSILTCIGEISSNFQKHATGDPNSVIIAKGNRDIIEIACADNGIGIISSLANVCHKNHYTVLEKAIEKNVTSKKDSAHMGCGLWLINQLVTESKGKLLIFSEKGMLENTNGKIKTHSNPYWKGTIIYLKLLLNKSVNFEKVFKSIDVSDIELNII